MFHGFRKYKKGHSINIEDISIDSIIQKKHKNSIIASQRRETVIGERAFTNLFIFFSILILVMVCVSFFYQVIDKDYIAKAERNKYIFKEINTKRGIIYDRDFQELVSNKQVFNLVLKDEDIDEKEFTELAKILALDIETLKANKKQEISVTEALVFKTRTSEFKSFELEKKNIRDYQDGYTFSHVIGYVSKDEEKGESGIEKEYDDILKEKPGITKYERDAQNNILSEELVKEPESGMSLILNIDKGLQKQSGEILKNAVSENNAEGGSIIIMNPQTGEVLTLVNYPSFDNNFFSKSFTKEEYQELLSSDETSFFNRAISGGYPLASTIKPILSTAFLEENIVTPSTKINCEGRIDLGGGQFKNDWTVHGPTDMRKAIAESCDVYFYVLGGGYENIKGLGANKIAEYLSKYGFGKATGIDLPSENVGFVGTPEWKKETLNTIWYPGDTYNLSIGQGYIKATPIQILTATSVIANGGKLIKPQIVKGITDDNKNIIEIFETEIINKDFISKESLKVAQEGMRQTVTSLSGSAPSLGYLGMDLAAKTGTAETGTGNTYHNWIVVYGPYEDPEIAMIVLMEHVSSFSGITQKIVREVFDYYCNRAVDKEFDN